MLVFVVSSMLAMGLGLTIAQIIAPLRNVRLLVLSLLANFVLMPLAAIALARLLRLDEPLGVGLLLLGAAAGAPFLPKLTQVAKGNLAFAVGLMVLLLVITVAISTGVADIVAGFRSTQPRSPAALLLSWFAGWRAGCESKTCCRRAANRCWIKPAHEPYSRDPVASSELHQRCPVRHAGDHRQSSFVAAAMASDGYWRPAVDTDRVFRYARRKHCRRLVGSQSFSDPVVVMVVVVVPRLLILCRCRMLAGAAGTAKASAQ
jgi:hypothetical protein